MVSLNNLKAPKPHVLMWKRPTKDQEAPDLLWLLPVSSHRLYILQKTGIYICQHTHKQWHLQGPRWHFLSAQPCYLESEAVMTSVNARLLMQVPGLKVANNESVATLTVWWEPSSGKKKFPRVKEPASGAGGSKILQMPSGGSGVLSLFPVPHTTLRTHWPLWKNANPLSSHHLTPRMTQVTRWPPPPNCDIVKCDHNVTSQWVGDGAFTW